MRNPLLFLIGTLALLLYGCVDTIILDPDSDPNDNVVINGKLTFGEPSTIFVQVNRFRPVDRFSNASPVGVERVDLIEVESGDSYRVPVSTQRRGFFGEITPGEPTISIELGRTYQIEVELNEGGIYRSIPQELYAVPQIEELTYTLSEERGMSPSGIPYQNDIITYQVRTTYERPDGAGNANLLWSRRGIFELDEMPGDDFSNICYLEYPIVNARTPILRGAEFTEGTGQSILVDVYRSNINYRYADGFLFTVFQQSVSREVVDYWDHVNTVINRTGTISEDPAGEVRGNMFAVNDPEEIVYGIFYAVVQDSASIYISPGEVGNPGHLCPIPPSRDPLIPPTPTICDDCEDLWEEGPVYLSPPPGWGG